jgi:hypothetical protein
LIFIVALSRTGVVYRSNWDICGGYGNKMPSGLYRTCCAVKRWWREGKGTIIWLFNCWNEPGSIITRVKDYLFLSWRIMPPGVLWSEGIERERIIGPRA